MKTTQLAVAFLSRGGSSHLEPKDERAVHLIAEGKSYQQIAVILEITTTQGRELYNRMRRIFLREARRESAAAEIDSLVATIKAANLSPEQISTEGLFSVRIQNALDDAGIKTLDDIIVRGRRRMRLVPHLGKIGFETIEAVLSNFDIILSD